MLGKVEATGGRISLQTAKEQLLYEVTDPAAYVTPDVTVDFRQVGLSEQGEDRIHVSGARAAGKSPSLKVSIGYSAGYLGEGEISYAGPNALARAQPVRVERALFPLEPGFPAGARGHILSSQFYDVPLVHRRLALQQ